MPPTADARWLVLVHQLPASPAYLRVKVWRRLQRIGAVALRGAVYVLPRTEEALEDLQWLAREIRAGGGLASLCEARFVDGTSDGELEAAFRAARDAEYAAVAADARALARKSKKGAPADELSALRARAAEIAAVDFFGASGREVVDGLLSALERKSRVVRGKDAIVRRRVWVTRTGIQVDRIACAWLIRRFVDREARFKFVSARAYVHKAGELRFDMADGEYTHEGERCSFETIAHRFGLSDPALRAIAEIVHDIDLKDDRFGRPETAGVAHLLAGIAQAHARDATRLARGSQLLDDLYESFATRRPR